jgi:hypothetical protein
LCSSSLCWARQSRREMPRLLPGTWRLLFALGSSFLLKRFEKGQDCQGVAGLYQVVRVTQVREEPRAWCSAPLLRSGVLLTEVRSGLYWRSGSWSSAPHADAWGSVELPGSTHADARALRFGCEMRYRPLPDGRGSVCVPGVGLRHPTLTRGVRLSYRAPPMLTLGPGGSELGRDTGPFLTVGILFGVPGVGLRHPTLTRGVRFSYRAPPTLTLGVRLRGARSEKRSR